MNENLFKEIGQLYVEWLNTHRNSYLYHKAFIDMMTKPDKDSYGDTIVVLDETSPDYDNTYWQEYQHKYSQESNKAQTLYRQLVDKADEYINQNNLENML